MRYWILLFAISSGLAAETRKDLNVVFILVDDWGWTDAGIQGSDFFETPYIDRFARESVRFTQAYAASPVCSPTRAAILTGRSPASLDMTIWHEGARDGGSLDRKLLPAEATPDLPREEVTLAERFKERAYATAHVGKWHLGRTAYYPETQGFDVNVGGTYWGAPATFFFPYRGEWSVSDPELRYVPIGMGKEGDYLTDRLTDHALEWLDRQKSGPFFLNLWYHTVHTPIEGKEAVVKRFRQKKPGQRHRHPEYAAMLESLDENVGRILERLDTLGLRDRTVVILTSDNGGVDFETSKSGGRPPTSNAPLRSGKGTLYEGGIRVPLFIRWPGKTVAGEVCDQPVISQDFFPTLMEGLAWEKSGVAALEGRSFIPWLEDPESPEEPRALFWHYPHYYPRMTPGSAIRDGKWKLIHFYEDDRSELYDLSLDGGETRDVAAVYPARVRTMRSKLDAWRREVGANAPRPRVPGY